MGSTRRFLCAALTTTFVACSTFTAAEGTSGPRNGGDGGTSSPPAVEDCFDGADDNGDGRRDCEEPTCAPYARCVPGPGALAGWSGYFTLVFGGDCPAEIPDSTGDVWVGAAEPAACAPCRCDASITCTGSVSLAESIYAACNPIRPFTLTIGQCGSIPTASGGTAQYWTLGGVGSPKCAASNDPPSLSTRYAKARLCSGARLGAGCPAGAVCGPSSLAATGPALCVSHPHPGGAPLLCPSAFPVAHLVAGADHDPETAFVDRRTCDQCKCSGPKGASCNAVLTLASDGACGNVKGTVTGSACTNVSCGSACGSGRVDVSPVPGTCTPEGGAALGAVELAVAGQQLCCDR